MSGVVLSVGEMSWVKIDLLGAGSPQGASSVVEVKSIYLSVITEIHI